MRATAAAFSRSVWKGPFFVHFPKLEESIKTGKPIMTKVRACTIMPNMVGARFMVHNGNRYLPVNVTERMVGRKLGEFSHTRKPFTYRLTKNK